MTSSTQSTDCSLSKTQSSKMLGGNAVRLRASVRLHHGPARHDAARQRCALMAREQSTANPATREYRIVFVGPPELVVAQRQRLPRGTSVARQSRARSLGRLSVRSSVSARVSRFFAQGLYEGLWRLLLRAGVVEDAVAVAVVAANDDGGKAEAEVEARGVGGGDGEGEGASRSSWSRCASSEGRERASWNACTRRCHAM